MQIKPDQLSKQLSSGLKAVYLVTGDEPLLIQEAVDEIRGFARTQGFDERKVFQVERGFDWQVLLEEAGSLSLFANNRIIELKLPNGKPGTDGSKKLVQFLDNPPDDTVLIIEAGKIDKKTLNSSKWCKAIDSVGVITQIWPIKPNEMLGFMRNRARKLKLDIAHDALELLSSRLEGNLLAAKQELDKLKLLHGTTQVSVGMIFEEVKDSARYDVFDLSKAMLHGDGRSASNILHHLQAEGTELTFVLWAISKDIRLISGLLLLSGQRDQIDRFYSAKRIFRQQQNDYNVAIRRLRVSDTSDALSLLKQADDAIKGVNMTVAPWLLVEEAVFRMCGHTLIA